MYQKIFDEVQINSSDFSFQYNFSHLHIWLLLRRNKLHFLIEPLNTCLSGVYAVLHLVPTTFVAPYITWHTRCNDKFAVFSASTSLIYKNEKAPTKYFYHVPLIIYYECLPEASSSCCELSATHRQQFVTRLNLKMSMFYISPSFIKRRNVIRYAISQQILAINMM